MKFSELENQMNSIGINTYADIARFLNTTPQAVSNWKARDQIPYHVESKLRQKLSSQVNENLIKQDYINDDKNVNLDLVYNKNNIYVYDTKMYIFIPSIYLYIT